MACNFTDRLQVLLFYSYRQALARLFIILCMNTATMKKIFVLLFAALLSGNAAVLAQKAISEGTIIYDISVKTNSKEPQMADAFDGATSTVYLKGSLSRIDMVSALGNEKTIHDARRGDGVVLKEYSGQKLMITLTKENWTAKNKKYEGVQFSYSNETKTIQGYTCYKATATLQDGTAISVFYTKDLVVTNKEYDNMFKDLPGLAMEYMFEDKGKLRFTYTVSKIDLSPVPLAKFDYPKTGYRVMTYDESQQAGKKD
jgi:GLPGLI family protein